MTLETVIIPVKWEEEESDFGGIFGLFVRHAAATAAAFLQFLDSENQSEVERIRDGPRPSSLLPGLVAVQTRRREPSRAGKIREMCSEAGRHKRLCWLTRNANRSDPVFQRSRINSNLKRGVRDLGSLQRWQEGQAWMRAAACAE